MYTKSDAIKIKEKLETKEVKSVWLIFDDNMTDGIGTTQEDIVKIVKGLLLKRCENVINKEK